MIPRAVALPSLLVAVLLVEVLLVAVGCSSSSVMPEAGAPATVELAPGQLAWLSTTGRSVGRGFEWTAVPLVCVTSAGALKTGADCLDALPVGAPVTTFQGRSARIAGPAAHPCSYEGRSVPGWALWIDPDAPQQSARPFSHVGLLEADGWQPRASRTSTDAERGRLPVLPPGLPPSPGRAPVVRTALTAELLPDTGLEVIIERHLAGAGSELWLVSEARVLALPFGAAPPDSLREVAGILDRGPDGLLAMVWSQSPGGGAGKHVVKIDPDSGSVDLLSEWWCGAPPPSSIKR